MNRIDLEINKFTSLRHQLEHTQLKVVDFDEYGFVITQPNSDRPGSAQKEPTIDLLLTGLTHGDEVIGIEAINLILEKILKSAPTPAISMGFLLNNVPAARACKRYIEKDLNRSFMIDSPQYSEERRALQISAYLQKASFVLDYHQTVEPTDSPFFILQHYPHLIELAHEFAPEIPIVTFPPAGLSYSGKTLNEYAHSIHVPSLAVEWGQKGFHRELAEKACQLFFRTAEHVAQFRNSQGRRTENQNSLNPATPQPSPTYQTSNTIHKKIAVYFLKEHIVNQHNARLKQGLRSMQKIAAGEVIGESDQGPIHSPCEGWVFFPKYGALAKASPELCEIGVKIDYRDV